MMLTLFRGGPAMWLSQEDADKIGVADNDWLEVYNRHGNVACRAAVSHRVPPGAALFYHSQDRHVNVPISEISGARGGTDNSLTRISIKPSHLIGGYAQLSWGFNYYGPDRAPAGPDDHRPQARERGDVLMKVRAQIGMVMNLDKCIGCHTCSVTCKNVWTNRPGTEYVWFNNVETKPGRGYPRDYEDQEKWKGGWELDRRGRLRLKAGGPLKKLTRIFWNPDLPDLDDYYEPWTYDYEHLISAPVLRRAADGAAEVTGHRARPRSHLGAELGRRPRRLEDLCHQRLQPPRASRTRSRSSSSRRS